MADADVVVAAESVVSERLEALIPLKETDQEEAEIADEAVLAVAVEGESHVASDVKRKLEDLEPLENDEAPAKRQEVCDLEPTSENSAPAEGGIPEALKVAIQETGAPSETGGSGHPNTEKHVAAVDVAELDAAQGSSSVVADQKGLIQVNPEAEALGDGQIACIYKQHTPVDGTKSFSLSPQQEDLPHAAQQNSIDLSTSSRKIEIPNNKVGVLIGRSGETIRYLQINSGAKIQITRDADAYPESSTRSVELIGTLENIDKAERLIKDVTAEADAGGSSALLARGFSTPQSGGEQAEMQVPKEKVGMIIGKGGETIKSLQTRTGCRIQVIIPQHLPDLDASKMRTVRITGNKKQVESAKEMIKDVMNQVPMRSLPPSSSYGQQAFRPRRGPAPSNQWGSRGSAPPHWSIGNGPHQRGMYPPPTTQYPQPYGGFSQQPPPPPPPRATFNSNWENQTSAPSPLYSGPQPGGPDYYNQGVPIANNQSSCMFPGNAQASTPAPLNYNYGQSQATDSYGHQAPYVQPVHSQQSYGQVYNEPKYESQPPSHQVYAHQQPISSQSGIYGQQSVTPNDKGAYGAPVNELPPSYGPPRGPSAPNQCPPYSAPMQQPYPYGSSAPAQQAPTDGYSQQPSTGYPQQVGQNAQPVPQSVQYPSSQTAYAADPMAQNNVNYGYGYQGGLPDATGYAGNVAGSGYGAPQTVDLQQGYSQNPSNASGYYDQSLPAQSGYGGVPSASVSYTNSVSPQPAAYGGQYVSTQGYSQH